MNVNKYINLILSLPRILKIFIVLATDILICITSTWISYYLRLGEWGVIFNSSVWRPQLAALVSIIVSLPIFIVSGFYKSVFRYSGISSAIIIARSILVYGLLYSVIFTFIGINGIPRTIGLIQPVILLIFILSSRYAARFFLGGLYLDYFRNPSLNKIFIYGTGKEGRQLADALSNSLDMRVAGFLDEDNKLHGQLLNNIPIYSIENIDTIAKNLGVEIVLWANQRTNSRIRNQIIQKLSNSKLSVRTLPSVNELIQRNFQSRDLRELEITDLIGREPIAPNKSLLKTKIENKIVLVTGAGGSIGSELCKQILHLHPKCLLILDLNEYALYAIDNALQRIKNKDNIKIIPLLARVQDRARISEIMKAWKPDTIYHAAAYKHVPLVEHNPLEGIYNNVFGTLVMTELALAYQVKDFVLISTDKAVRPTNIMGATKRLSEIILQSLAANNEKTILSIVRFGNVLGSSGSVVPKFREQILHGGPITLTHKDVMRYFMTIPEAAQLVMQAGAMALGGEVFLLDMGEPVRIYDLAKTMVELTGNTLLTEDNPTGKIAIEITGLRPGEKLFEELLIAGYPEQTEHPRIMKASEEFMNWTHLSPELDKLSYYVESKNVVEAIKILKNTVTNYTNSESVYDWVYLQLNK